MKTYIPPQGEQQIKVYSLGRFVVGMESRIRELESLIRETDNLEWFDNLWESNANCAEWFGFVQVINPGLSYVQWEIAWQWRTILHENRDQAIIEFVNAILGWY